MVNNVKARTFCFIVYDESCDVCVLVERLNNYCDYVYILHDKDIDLSNDTLKKPHYHFIIRFPNARWLSAVSNDLGIDMNYFEPCRNVKSAMQYLIHFNDNNKYQYSKEEVQGNIVHYFNKCIADDDLDEESAISRILDFIDHADFLSVSMLSRYCVSSGLWSYYRRAYSIIYAYMQEHNNFIN